MKIEFIKVNGFGKLKDKDISFKEGINIVYGKNETGKSSILKFISSMLYGSSKNKNGKDISDFEKFKPWKTEEFSGKITYTLDNGKKYEVYREFKKKNPIIYNENQEDISKEFQIDKTKGIDFFTEQTGIDEETFYNTAITEQEGVKLSKSSQNTIIQRISNLISTGKDNISFKKSLEKINKLQNEEVGTERTSQRPINIVQNKIHLLLEKKKSLAIFKENKQNCFLEKEQLYLQEKDEEVKIKFLKEVKTKLDNFRLKSAEINFNKNLENEYETKIDELNKKIEKEYKEEYYEKSNFTNYYIFLIMSLVFNLLSFTLKFNVIFRILTVILSLSIIISIIYKKWRISTTIQNKINADKSTKERIINEIEVLRENREQQKKEANTKQEKLNLEIEKENKDLINKFNQFLDLGFMEENIKKNYDEILKEIDKRENRLNTIKFRIHTIENEDKNIMNKLEDLSSIEEDLQNAEEEREELISLNNSYNLAKECLEKAYKEVKDNISPRFTENLCDIISKISNGRYKKVMLNDVDGLVVEIENGNYIPASRLSIGTIDQMYLSLRLSALNEITDETLPIILDEVFAYFDDDRLLNILKYLKVNFPNHQIIILTCTKREIEALNHLNMEYNLINLEK